MKITKLVGGIGFFLFANQLKDRFVAGETINDAVERAKALKQRGEKAVINILGEHIKNGDQAEQICEQYRSLMMRLAAEDLYDTRIAVKPSQLGLEISEGLYKNSLREILDAAANLYLPKALVEVDRETHDYAKVVRQVSLDLAKRSSNQRVACQINFNETREEIRQFIKAGISVRLCKGNAYAGDIEEQAELRKIFLEQAAVLIEQGNKPVFATHDLYLIDSIIEQFGQYKDRFEIDLLLGIEENLAREPGKEGFTFGRYLPCGLNWRPYGQRRAEAIVGIWWRNWWYRIKKGGER